MEHTDTRHYYQGVSVTQNIEKHASAMLYPLSLKHPHPEFSQYDRLIIDKIYDDQLRKLYHDNLGVTVSINGVEYQRNPFDFIAVKDIDCKCDDKVLYEQLFGDPTDQQLEVMAYKSCKHTIYAAAKRQMKMAPTPDPLVADDFLEYSKHIIEEEIGEELTHFGYSYQQWYSHLNKAKQNDMDLVSRFVHNEFELLDPDLVKKLSRQKYEGICKVELQNIDGKPRMVCAIPPYVKYVMGPITWKLEEICSQKFKGYCGGKNLTEMADMVNKYADDGFTKVIEGDGSAFDNTQDITLKRVDHYIYQRVAHAVYHVDPAEFLRIATEYYKTMDVLVHDPTTKKKKMLFTYKILGSVFSGDCDTTLMNTLRMALYNRYINDKAGFVYGVDYICYSKGDDFTVQYKPYITDDQIRHAYYQYFVPAIKDVTKPDTRVYGLGQVLKMLDIGGLDSIKFCSLRSWYINDNHIMLTRDPKKLFNLAKYSRKTKTMQPRQVYTYLIQQAEALEASYSGINIFDTMAKCYRERAKYFLQLDHINTQEYEKWYLAKLQKRKAHLDQIRQQYSNYEQYETEIYQHVYNIQYRDKFVKIQEDYWESVQQYERVITTKFTPDELARINQQIDKEFSTEELKSILGLNNEN